MRRTGRNLLLVLGMLLAVTVPASAAEETGTISVSPLWGDTTVSGGEVTLYRVGEAEEENYKLTDGLANWTIMPNELYDPELAEWLAGKNATEGVTKVIEDSAGAEFSNLEAGVYLLVQTKAAAGYAPFKPYLVALPMEGPVWDIPTYPKVELQDNPKTGDSFAPVFWTAATAVSGIGLAACGVRRRRK